MKVRIVTNDKPGAPVMPGWATQIMDAETGEPVEGVYKITVNMDMKHPITALVYAYAPIVDVIADAEIRHVCRCCGHPIEQE